LIHESRYAEFRDHFRRPRPKALKVGSGLDKKQPYGAVDPWPPEFEKCRALFDDALAAGGQALLRGEEAIPGKGYFYPPTVLEDVPSGARVQQIEPFGPIAVLQPFSTLDDALAQAMVFHRV